MKVATSGQRPGNEVPDIIVVPPEPEYSRRRLERENDFQRAKFAIQRLCGPDSEHRRGHPELQAAIDGWWKRNASDNGFSNDVPLAYKAAVFLEREYLPYTENRAGPSPQWREYDSLISPLFFENALRSDNREHVAFMIQAGYLFAAREAGRQTVTKLAERVGEPGLELKVMEPHHMSIPPLPEEGNIPDREYLLRLADRLAEPQSPRMDSGRKNDDWYRWVAARVTSQEMPEDFGLDKPVAVDAVLIVSQPERVGIGQAVAAKAIANLQTLAEPIATMEEYGERQLAGAAGITNPELAKRVFRELARLAGERGLKWNEDLDISAAVGFKSAGGGITGALVPLNEPKGDTYAISSVMALGNASSIIAQTVAKDVFDDVEAKSRN